MDEFLDPVFTKNLNLDEVIGMKYDEEYIEYTIRDIVDIYDEYYPVLEFCYHYDNGLFTVSLSDWNMLPSVLIDTIILYKSEKDKLMKQRNK